MHPPASGGQGDAKPGTGDEHLIVLLLRKLSEVAVSVLSSSVTVALVSVIDSVPAGIASPRRTVAVDAPC